MWGLCGAALVPGVVMLLIIAMTIPLMIEVPSFTIDMAEYWLGDTLRAIISLTWPAILKIGLIIMVSGYIVTFDKFIQANRGETGEGVCAQ